MLSGLDKAPQAFMTQAYFRFGLQGLTVSFTVVAGRCLSVPFGRNRPFLASRTRVPGAFDFAICLPP